MRLFVGLDLPWELRQRMAMLAGAGIPGARWVPQENYHVTLRFIGETPRYRGRGNRPRAGRAEGAGVHSDAGRCRHLRQGRPQQSLWVGVERNPTARPAAGQDRDGAAALRPGAGAAALPAAPDPGAAGRCARRRSSRALCRRTTCSAPTRCRLSISRCSVRCWARSRRCTRRRWNIPSASIVTVCNSERRIAAHRDAVHDPRLRRIIVDRKVLRAAIVPERQRAGLPAERGR